MLAISLAPATVASAQTVSLDPYRLTRIPTDRAGEARHMRRQDPRTRALEPVGIHAGSLTIHPKIEATLAYDDNIYALQRGTDDRIARLSPSLTIFEDQGLLTSTLRATLDTYRYFNNGRENRMDASVGSTHRLELAPETFVSASGAYSRNHEDRGDPNTLSTNRSPTRYTLGEASIGATRDLARLRAGVGAGLRRFNYRDARRLDGGLTDFDFRDRTETKLDGRIGYAFSPGYVAFGRVEYDRADYDELTDNGGFRRDSRGVRATAGIQFELTRILTGNIRAGYVTRSYEEPRFRDVRAAVVAAALGWAPTSLTTVRLSADRTVQETVFTGFRGFLHTGGSLVVQHELRRQITLTGGLSYYRDRYMPGAGLPLAPRSDDVYEANAGVRYILNRNLYTGLSYEFLARGSTAILPGSDYKRDRVIGLIGLQM